MSGFLFCPSLYLFPTPAYPFGLMPDHIIHQSSYGPNTFGYGLQTLPNQPMPMNPFGTAGSTQCISGGT